MLDYKSSDSVQFVFLEASVLSERNRIEPKLGNMPITLDVNMRGFLPIRAEENETIRPILQHSRHGRILVGGRGFEPLTFCTSSRRSSAELTTLEAATGIEPVY
jgi:hypothetical protein